MGSLKTVFSCPSELREAPITIFLRRFHTEYMARLSKQKQIVTKQISVPHSVNTDTKFLRSSAVGRELRRMAPEIIALARVA